MIVENFLKLTGVVAIIKNLYFVFSDLGDHFRVSDYEDNCISNSGGKMVPCMYLHSWDTLTFQLRIDV